MLTDDQITDRIADEVVARIHSTRPGFNPDADPELSKQLVRLYTRQALGVQAALKNAEVALLLNDHPRRTSETYRRAFMHVQHHGRKHLSELNPFQ